MEQRDETSSFLPRAQGSIPDQTERRLTSVNDTHRPNHVITFVRPKANQPPTTATFEVPLTFNKLDFRDYLWNVYNVEVNGVRSFINQMMVRQRTYTGFGGKYYRPRSQKLMVVDLVKPFVWPEVPAEKDAWDNKMFSSVEKTHKEQLAADFDRARGTPALRPETKTPDDRVLLRNQAKELMSGARKWRPSEPLGPGWAQVQAPGSAGAGEGRP